MPMRMQPVILAGGNGQRLAPLSTDDCPKPFIAMPSGSSLLQQTLKRIGVYDAPILIAQHRHRFALMNHAHEAKCEPRAMLLEPKVANTTMAIATVTAWICEQGESETVLAFLPADHAIADASAWHTALITAVARAEREDVLMLIGMLPENASRELGYMQLEEGRVLAFREKPADAQTLIAQGWRANSGQVIARASVLADSLRTHAPQIWDAAERAVRAAQSDREFIRLHEEPYSTLLPVAFDRAVLEKATNLGAIACACGWRDIGTIDAFCEHASLRNASAPLYPRTDRPWGYSETVSGNMTSLAKCLTLYPRRRLSLQRHAHRIEVWLVLEGEALVELDGDYHMLQRGQSLTIPQGAWHRLINAGTGILRLMELQVGRCDENDIERREDDYGRV